MASDGSSSGGSLIGGIFGAVVGFFLGGPAGAVKGFMYGSTIGGLLAPPTGPDQFGPRLDSLKITTSSNVATRPRAYGTVAHHGNLTWAKDDEYVEVATTKKVRTGLFSKTKVTTYSYFFTGIYTFARTEVSKVLRVWHAGGRDLVYSATSTDPDTQIASGEFLKYCKFYLGTDTQTADEIMATDVGAASASGHPGDFHIRYNMYPLENYQNNVGNLDPKVEYTTVDVDTSDIDLLENIPAATEGSEQDHYPLLHNVPFVGPDGADLWRLGLADTSGYTSTITGNLYTATPDGNLIYRSASTPIYDAGELASNTASHGKSDRRVFVSSSLYITATYVGSGGTQHPLISQPASWTILPQTFGSLWESSALPYYEMDGTFASVIDSLYAQMTLTDEQVYQYFFSIDPFSSAQTTQTTETPFIFQLINGPGTFLFSAISTDPSVAFDSPVTEEWYGDEYTYEVTLRVFVHDQDGGAIRNYLVPVGSSVPSRQTHYCYIDDVLYFVHTVSGVNYINKILKNGLRFTSPLGGDLAGLSLIKIGPLNDELMFVFSDGGDCIRAGLDFDFDIGAGTIDATDMDVYLDAAEVLAEFGNKSSAFFNNVSFDFNQMFYCLGGNILRRESITGDEEDFGDAPDLILGTSFPSSFNIWKLGNLLAVSTYGGAMDKVGVQWFSLGIVASPGKILLADVLTAENALAGITSSSIDVTTIDQEVRGYVVSEIGPIRNVTSQLQAIFPFDVIQSGYKNKYVKRGLTSVATVTWQELGQGISLTQDREMETQLPYKVELTYIDVDLDYAPNVQFAERVSSSKNIVRLNIPIVLTASEAAQAAEILLGIYHMERRTFAFTLPPTYRNLEPSDIITLAMKDVTYVVRLTNVHYLANGQLECQAKQHRETVYTSTAAGASGQIPKPTTIPSIANPIAGIFDMPTITDANNAAGYSAVMASLSDSWVGGDLFRTLDNQASWQNVASFGFSAVWGICTTVLGAHGGHVIDEGSELIVKPYNGEFASVTETQFLNEETLIVYGVPGRFEIIGYKTAVDNMDGTYTLSYLMRGRRGTEQYTGTHAVNDYFALISSSKFIGATTASLDTLIINRAVTVGREIDSASNINLTYAGVNLTPLSPVDAFGVRDSSDNLTGYFTRRTRLNDGLSILDQIYAGVPIGEAAESYEIDIMDGDDVKRMIPATSETFEYSAADQITDFGSEQSSVLVNIYQISAAVGRGYVGAFTI
jgi:hypothetical protein